MRSRKALAPSAATIVETAGPNGNSGYATSGTTSQKPPRTLSASSKFFRTSGWTLSVVPLMTPTLKRRGFAFAGAGRNGRGSEVASRGSLPAIAAMTRPQSWAERHIGPSLSSVQQSAIAPCRLTRPYVGLRPATPENAAGVRMEPEVSEPIENPTRPAAVAAPGPEDEPPDQKSVFQGVRPGPVNDASALL